MFVQVKTPTNLKTAINASWRYIPKMMPIKKTVSRFVKYFECPRIVSAFRLFRRIALAPFFPPGVKHKRIERILYSSVLRSDYKFHVLDRLALF